jgi:dTDP-D-glucose 4,6-dehydratase
VKIPIHGDGSSKRTFIHSLDIAKAFETIIYKGTIGEVYNIGTEMEYTVLDVVDIILKHMKSNKGLTESIEHVEDRKFQDYRYWIDSSKLRKIGWKETITFEDAIRDILRN